MSTKNIGIFPSVKRIIALGDIHADYDALIYSLRKVKLINKRLDWKGGDTILIQIGDIVDGRCRIGNWRGDNDLKVINFLSHLRKQADKKGGKIIILMGNHEIMNYNGNFTYSGDNGIKSLGGEKKRLEYFRNQFKDFMLQSYVAVKFGDWVFCHAGIPSVISNTFTIPDLNILFYQYINGNLSKPIEKKFLDIISSEVGILTNRKFGGEKVQCKKVIDTLKNLHANHMVVGHTVQDSINSVCDHKIWRIDTGISRAFGNNNPNRIQLLEISNYGKNVKII